MAFRLFGPGTGKATSHASGFPRIFRGHRNHGDLAGEGVTCALPRVVYIVVCLSGDGADVVQCLVSAPISA